MGERERGTIRAPRADGRRSYRYRPTFPVITIVALILGWAAAHSAQAVPLSSLQEGGSILWGDKLFTNFSVTPTGPASDSVNLGLIDVVGYTAPGPNGDEHGIKFRSGATAPNQPIISAGPGLFVDVLIRFDVLVQNPLLDIHDLTLGFVTSDIPPDGHAQVVETALVNQPSGGPIVVGQTFVSAPIPNRPTSHILLDGQHHELRIVKDIAVIGGGQQGASIFEITQTFSQIPEPATLLFLGLGSLAFVGRRRDLRRMGRVLAPAVAGLIVFAGGPSAQAVLLDTLVTEGGSLTEGDKRFENFGYTINENINATIFSASAINVATRTEGQDIVLSLEGLFAALSTVQANSRLRVTIDFDVIVLTYPNQALHDLGIFFNGQPLDPQDASAQVVETVTTTGVNPVPVATLTVSNPGPLTDHVDLPATYQSVHVSKEIIVDGGRASISTISVIEQRFSQIPEPATLAGLVLSLPFLSRRRRRL